MSNLVQSCGHHTPCGCEVIRKCCLDCPLEVCILDLPPARKRTNKPQVALSLYEQGYSMSELQDVFGLSRRRVFALLNAARVTDSADTNRVRRAEKHETNALESSALSDTRSIARQRFSLIVTSESVRMQSIKAHNYAHVALTLPPKRVTLSIGANI